MLFFRYRPLLDFLRWKAGDTSGFFKSNKLRHNYLIKVKLILFIFKKGVIWRYIEELAFHYKIKKGRLAENIVDKGSAKPQHSIKSAARPPYLYTIIYLYYTVA